MPKIVEQTEARLVIRVGDPLFAGGLLALSVICAGAALALYLGDTQGTERFWGLVCGAVLFGGGFLAVFEQAEFCFERPTRTLHWMRRRAFRQRSGTLAWNQIRAVEVQPFGSASVGRTPTWRVALRLATDELPLTSSYAPDPDGSLRELAQTVERFLERSPTP